MGEAQTLKSLASAFLNYGNAAEAFCSFLRTVQVVPRYSLSRAQGHGRMHCFPAKARARAKLAVDIGKDEIGYNHSSCVDTRSIVRRLETSRLRVKTCCLSPSPRFMKTRPDICRAFLSLRKVIL